MTKVSERLRARHRADPPSYLYAIGLGSNRPFSGKLGPGAIVEAALTALDRPPLSLLSRSVILGSAPIGPSRRTYANAAAVIASALQPLAMLDWLQALEARFGRRRHQRWGARTLDLDMLLWSGGRVRHKRLIVPHPALRERSFVLKPMHAVAPRWRDPVSHLCLAHLAARFAKAKPVDRMNRSL